MAALLRNFGRIGVGVSIPVCFFLGSWLFGGGVLAASEARPGTAYPLNPLRSTPQDLADGVKRLGQELTRRQSGENRKLLELVDRSRSGDQGNGPRMRLQWGYATMSEGESGEADQSVKSWSGVSEHIGRDTQRVVEDYLIAHSMLRVFKQGFAFESDNLFNMIAGQRGAEGGVRYVLRVSEVTPIVAGREMAALGPDPDVKPARARVRYDVVPSTDIEPERPAFSWHDAAAESSQSRGYWPKIPRLAFRGRLMPNGSWVGNQGRIGFPGVVAVAEQSDGLYGVEHKTDSQLQQTSLVHRLSVPVVGKLRVVRRLDRLANPIDTELSGILVDKRAPSLGTRWTHGSSTLETKFELNLQERGTLIAKHEIRPDHDQEPHGGWRQRIGLEYRCSF